MICTGCNGDGVHDQLFGDEWLEVQCRLCAGTGEQVSVDVICSWCGDKYDEKLMEPGSLITHGMCRSCQEKMLEEAGC